jgi:hypothetical protein
VRLPVSFDNNIFAKYFVTLCPDLLHEISYRNQFLEGSTTVDKVLLIVSAKEMNSNGKQKKSTV